MLRINWTAKYVLKENDAKKRLLGLMNSQTLFYFGYMWPSMAKLDISEQEENLSS